MRISLAITPYFTNGDTPPLGLAYLNAVLREADHDVSSYDLISHTLRDYSPYLAQMRKIVNLGNIGRKASFFLNIEFAVYSLYGADEPERPWLKDLGGPEKAAWAACAMMLDELTDIWAGLVLEKDPELILLSAYTSNVFSTFTLAKKLRKRSSAPVVVGGPGVGLDEIHQLAFGAGLADGVVVGEGERTVVEMAEYIEQKSALPENMPGLAVKGKPLIPRNFITDLDDLPAPLYEGLPAPGLGPRHYESLANNPYKSPFFEGLPVMASRGCANRCAYCSESAYWRKWRRRRPESLAEEIIGAKEATGRDVFLFCDSALNLDAQWLSRFCDAIRPAKARFLSYMVAHRDMDEGLALKMREAGWGGAVVGVETFSDKLRKKFRKKMSRAQAMDSIRRLARADIWVKANILCGFPGETEDDVDDTIAAMEELNAEPEVKRRLWWDAGHPLRLEPYSDMYNHPDKYGVKIRPYKLELPSGLADIQPLIDKLTLTWDPGIPPETVAGRSRRIIDASHNPES